MNFSFDHFETIRAIIKFLDFINRIMLSSKMEKIVMKNSLYRVLTVFAPVLKYCQYSHGLGRNGHVLVGPVKGYQKCAC